MKALVCDGPNKISLREVAQPLCAGDGIRIQVYCAGVCATDIRIFRGTKRISYPRILGHEFSGIIDKVGKNVDSWKVGTRVTVYPTVSCGECYACKAGKENICLNRHTIGYEHDGGFAEYVSIPASALRRGNVSPLPAAVSMPAAAVSEPLAAACHGITQADLQEGDSILIIGAGAIGLFHVQLAKLKRPGLIIVIEPVAAKRKMALEQGADHALDPAAEDLRDRIFALTENRGVDKILLDVSASEPVPLALELLKKGGRLILFAGMPLGTTVPIDPNLIHYRELVFTGSSSASPAYQREVLRLIAEGSIDVSPFIQSSFSLEQWRQAFEEKEAYRVLKPLFRIRQE